MKDLVFEWAEGTTPQISEIYLLGALSGMDSDLIAELQETVDAAGQQDTSAWTTDSINALNAAVEQAKDAIAHPESLTADQVEDIKAAIETALNSPVLKYTGTELSELVNGAITDGSRYTDETWQAYGEALAAAKVGLEKGDNLSQAEAEQLVSALKAARDGLKLKGESGNGGSGGGNNGGSGAGNGADTGTGSPQTKPNGGLPATGDSSLIPVIALGALGAIVVIAGIAMVVRRRGGK